MRTRKRFRGRHKFICDVDGFQYYSEDKVQRWDGAIVHKMNTEQRHPQDLIKAVREDTSIKDPRPDREPIFITRERDGDGNVVNDL